MADMGSQLAGNARGEEGVSVVAAVARWRATFVTVFVLLFALKFWLVITVQPLGDEAFYWQESRHLAWGYSDLPPLTAWLIRFGEALAGHGLFGMRWPFLLLGSALPWLTVAFARDAFGDARSGWQAGLLCLCLPLAGSLGVLALPDVPLTFGCMLAIFALWRAQQRKSLRNWLWLGVAVALCWLSHYRAAMLMLAGLLFLIGTAQGRPCWKQPGFWLAMAIGALGMVPLIVSNWQMRGAGLAFQLVERNPWRFHADTLVQPLEQAVVCTPLLYLLMLWAAWQAWRRRQQPGPWALVAFTALTFVLVYFVAGLFADDQRFRVHWPLPGYLPLLAVLPALLREIPGHRFQRIYVMAAVAIAAIAQLAGLLYLGLAAMPATAYRLGAASAFPTSLIGWRESADAAQILLRQKPSIVVADNFMLAAELDFQFDGRYPVYSLDSPLNTKYGRAPQLTLWNSDERALRATHANEQALLIVDERALRERERPAWLASLCTRLDDLQPVGRLSLFEGRKQLAFYRGRVMEPTSATTQSPAQCVAWRDASAN